MKHQAVRPDANGQGGETASTSAIAFSDAVKASRCWLFEELLPVWSTVGRCSGGGFVEQIGQDGVALSMRKRCRVQARQVYVFAEAGRLGWNGPWRELVGEGMDLILSRYVRGDGLVRFAVDRDGRIVDDNVDNYDQAFTLFALASAYRLDRAPELLSVAERLLKSMREQRGLASGGFSEGGKGVSGRLLANPHMHFFEAALAWIELGVDGPFRDLAQEIHSICAKFFIDSNTGALREFFGPDWRPADGADGQLIEPGHQFEWAWLLLRWANLGGDVNPCLADRLYRFADRFGVDRSRSVAVAAVDLEGAPLDSVARLWPQTERMKAALALLALASDEDALIRYKLDLVDAWKGLRRFSEKTGVGLYFDKMNADGSFVPEPAFASSLYHITCAISELSNYPQSGTA